jgi:hypothetical protein
MILLVNRPFAYYLASRIRLHITTCGRDNAQPFFHKFQDKMTPSSTKQEITILNINTSTAKPFESFNGLLTPEEKEIGFEYPITLGTPKEMGLPTPSESIAISETKQPRKRIPIRAVAKTNCDPGFIIQLGFGIQSNVVRKVNYELMPHLEPTIRTKRDYTTFAEPVHVEKQKRKRGSRRSSVISNSTTSIGL